MDNNLQPLTRSDRDMIVSLNVKVDRLISDVKDIKDDTSVRIAKIEDRLEAIDKLHASIDFPKYQKLASWTEDLRANFRLLILIGGIILAILEAFLSRMIARYFGF